MLTNPGFVPPFVPPVAPLARVGGFWRGDRGRWWNSSQLMLVPGDAAFLGRFVGAEESEPQRCPSTRFACGCRSM
jgi:hypothetical protein